MKTLAVIAVLALCFPVFQRLHKDEYPIQKFGTIKNGAYQFKRCGEYFVWAEKDKILGFKILAEETGIKINGEESGILNCELHTDSFKVELDNTRAFPAIEMSKKHPPVVILISDEDYKAAGCLPQPQK